LDVDHILDGELADDLLGLIFMSCHPILSPDARSALTLKLVCGLTTDEVARALLAPESTIAQRIVRAKRTLAAARIRFELPGPGDRSERLDAVREVIYLVFNEGYAATSGDRRIRSELCNEALRLGRMLASLTPNDAESLGLLALIEIQASRLAARVGPKGEPVLLMDQNRGRWDQLLIQRGLALIDRIDRLHGTTGPYALQAAIAACHARARRPEDTDWLRIAALYDGLGQIAPSPIVELNRAVAVAEPSVQLPGLRFSIRSCNIPHYAAITCCRPSRETSTARPATTAPHESISCTRQPSPPTVKNAPPCNNERPSVPLTPRARCPTGTPNLSTTEADPRD
jgi:predicted RNA polymerase sigma factor